MLATKRPVFRQAVRKLVRVNSSEEQRYLEDMYLSTQLERQALLASGEEKGHAKGYAERTIQMARALKTKGVDITIIAETSGLTTDAIRKL